MTGSDGGGFAADALLRVRDPRTGRDERALAPPTRAGLADTLAALRHAQPAWEALGAAGRAAALRELAVQIALVQDELVEALGHDTGRRTESVMEVQAVLGGLARWGAAPTETGGAAAGAPTALPWITARSAERPYQLAAVISPWNFPLLLGTIDLIPALAAGCAAVVKPSEVTPRFLAPLRRALDAVPALAPVVALVEGGAEVGAALVDAADVVCFTGSVATGRAVAERAARAFVPAHLELGGKDAAIVLPGADLQRAASAILWGATANAGQSCLSIERVYVHRKVFDEFTGLLCDRADALGLAWPDLDAGGIGPLIDPAQAAVIREHLDDAYEQGAHALVGGTVEELGGGLWCRPTVLTAVHHGMRVMAEETFGPIVPLMSVYDTDEAVRLANDTSYGLSAAVFAADEDAALAVARRLDAGAVSVNDAGLTAFVHDAEKNSFGMSGLGGSRMGAASIRRFVRRQAFLVNNGPKDDPWWWDAAPR
ncbi:aldehyde dehydrogenase family protein [Yinghuangia seranimata]|uniref:aldehyde dehydrogenase family protein n=1 Tax=Yinghuangia seranimata TaxID=408067 RepID=UPI00248C7CC3|nr:aldehyde dehydrogenase family protein [Yinghuangia seranimata]MDI2131877.1 aldehyde dehydrogenase family protein [Yinghuangia seranimata]